MKRADTNQGTLPFDGHTYQEAHDGRRLSAQQRAVYDRMKDGRWWTVGDLVNDGVPGADTGISARVRDLRKDRYGAWDVKRRRRRGAGTGTWEYQLVPGSNRLTCPL